ncbi:hypothetical protein TNCV_2342471 [Trichonephila clavipes]|nr:hypothetical protein TNCV_2342471 [Trichonephila clavipes]
MDSKPRLQFNGPTAKTTTLQTPSADVHTWIERLHFKRCTPGVGIKSIAIDRWIAKTFGGDRLYIKPYTRILKETQMIIKIMETPVNKTPTQI